MYHTVQSDILIFDEKMLLGFDAAASGIATNLELNDI